MAVTTSTQICNMALGRLGAETISNLDDDESINAGYCKFVYPRARNWLLRDHEWSFSIRRETLALPGGANLTPFAYKYQRPANMLKLIELIDENYAAPLVAAPNPWIQEDQYIYADLENAIAKYIWEVTNTQRFDETFVQVLALLIAHRLAMWITVSDKIMGDVYRQFRFELREATGLDAVSAESFDAEPPLWTNSR